MKIAILILMSLIGAVAGLTGHWLGLGLVVLGAVAILTWCLYHDLRILKLQISDASQPTARGFHAKAVRHRPLTTLGRMAAENVETLRYRMNALNWQAEVAPTLIKSSEQSDSVETKSKITGSAELFNRVLEEAGQRFRARGMAIVFEDTDQKQKVLSQGIAGARFESELIRYLDTFFSEHRETCFGIRDGLMSASLCGDLALFGLRYSIAYPFFWSNSNSKFRGVIWFGYSPDVTPTELEAKWAKELAEKVQLELQSMGRVFELSEQYSLSQNSNQEKNDFMAHMSHDLRSPLNNIKAILNLVRLEHPEVNSDSMIEVALGNCDQMAELVEDVLDFSRHRVGRLTSQPEKVDLGKLVEEAAMGFIVAARLKGLQFSLTLPEEPMWAMVDKRQTRRILINLISNAIKYTQYGSVTILGEPSVADTWLISVRDTGIGLSSDDIQKLFQPFSRLQVGGEDGVGLGLALSRILTELNGGLISVQSKLGAGSAFELRLPTAMGVSQLIVKPEANKLEAAEIVTTDVPGTSQATKSPQTGLVQPRVLLIDDDIDSVETLARALSSFGIETLKAISVKDALSLINFDTPALIITDANMPDGGGRRILQYLREQRKSSQVLVLSGTEGKLERAEFQALGAIDLWEKPVDIERLAAWVRQAFQGIATQGNTAKDILDISQAA